MLSFTAKLLSKTTKDLLPRARSMSGLEVLKKAKRYDGRTKKRKWEERRSDYVKTSAEEHVDDKKPKTENADRVKRRKYVLMLGYSGVDYYGMQRNPFSKTIEEDLCKALLKTNLITQEAYDQMQTIHFQRAARTDKGVSAVRQVVSLKLPEVFDFRVINEELPSQIKVFGAKRVTKGFNSKSNCDARTYSYMLPTIAFSSYTNNATMEEFRLTEEAVQIVNDLLKNYVGTKNYHNFTSKKKPTDPSANRYIVSFTCDPPFVRKDVEFTVLKVKGQSFMLHQIRKMVGLVIAISRGHTTKDIFNQVFTTETVNLPRAPGLGLVLEYVHYDRYNYRYGEDGMHEKLTWDELDKEVEEFKEEYIYPTIVNTEVNEKSMITWLDRLFLHSYDRTEEEEVATGEASDDEAEDSVVVEKNSEETNQGNSLEKQSTVQ